MGLSDRRQVVHAVLDLECDCFSWFQHFQVSLLFRFVFHADAVVLFEHINYAVHKKTLSFAANTQ